MYTKEELEKLSDFGLSSSILILKCKLHFGFTFPTTASDSQAGIEYKGEQGSRITSYFDINNWSDMGPLIKGRDICLVPPYADNENDTMWEARSDITEESYESMGFTHSSISKEPLRAAAIVYLLGASDGS